MTPTAAPPATAVSHDTVALTKIALHPRNPRRDVGNVDDLAASMLEVGVLQDLVVAPWPAGLDITKPRGATYVLIAGHRRYAAAKVAKLKDVPVKVRGDLDTLPKQLEAMLVENLHRADLTPVEEADTYQALLDLEGLTQTALAKSVGQPVTRIRERLKLARLEQPVKEKVHTGQLTIGDAIAIGSFADDEKTSKQLLEAVGGERFGWQLEQAQQRRRRLADLEKRLEPFRAAGFPIEERANYEDPKGWKPLSAVLPEIPEYGMPSDERDAKVLELHGDCLGRAVVIRYTDSVYHYCSEPNGHPKVSPKKSRAEQKREAEEKAAKAQYNENAPIATAIRRAHLAAFLAGDPDEAIARGPIERSLLTPAPYATIKDTRAQLELVGSLCGLANPHDVTYDDLVAYNEKAVANLPFVGLVLLDQIVESRGELALDRRNEMQSYQVPTNYVRDLNDRFGYQWTDWERTTFRVDETLVEPDPDWDAGDLDEDDIDAEDAEVPTPEETAS